MNLQVSRIFTVLFLSLAAAFITGCPSKSGPSAPSSSPTATSTPTQCSSPVSWIESTASGPMSARSNFPALTYDPNDGKGPRIYIFGGGFTSSQTNDVWSSFDGIHWTEVTSAAAWSGRYGHSAAVYNGKMWIMGGNNGASEVWYSTDGAHWTNATTTAAWGPRHHQATLVFDNGTGSKMWVLGGNNGTSQLSDVWSSSDGVTWTEATASAAFGVRETFGSVVYNGAMWVMGGGGSCPSGLYTDVYSSTDGASWTKATASAAFGQVNAPRTLNYGGYMWLVGGDQCGTASSSYVWYSSDGATWTASSASPVFSSRSFLAATVYNGFMWVIGGAQSGGGTLLNDVWHDACN